MTMTKIWIETMEIGQRVRIRGFDDVEHVITGKRQDEFGVWFIQLDGDAWYETRGIKLR